MPSWNVAANNVENVNSTLNSGRLTDLKCNVPLDTKIGHFGDILPSQRLGLVPNKLNLTLNNTETKWQKHTRITVNPFEAIRPKRSLSSTSDISILLRLISNILIAKFTKINGQLMLILINNAQ